MRCDRWWNVVGMVIEGAGFLVAGLNLFLSLRRPVPFKRRGGSLDGYRHVSGFPLVGTPLVVLGALAGFGAIVPAMLGLVAVAIDTGGPSWFLHATWRDSSLWDT